MRNVRASTLKKYLNDSNFKLSQEDRAFLADLSKVGIIDEKDADTCHYQSRKTRAATRLDRLCEIGLLESQTVVQPGRGRFKAYHFKTERIATLFGGKKPIIGRKRNALHEVITSRIYFAEGRPESFTLEAAFDNDQRALFNVKEKTLKGRDACLPDAMFVRDGNIVVVEADSGQYSKSQIANKQAAWQRFEQVWGQPSKASARVSGGMVHTFS
ncbi:MAG: hypothetical protein MI976_11380 [Pseudomonadales bacterium]|nr:hypothetical protein [Pseudomonadales bacterium]